MAAIIRRAGYRSRYRRRQQVVEPVVAQIKQASGLRRFLRRGLASVQGEGAMLRTAHTLRWRTQPRDRPPCSAPATPPTAPWRFADRLVARRGLGREGAAGAARPRAVWATIDAVESFVDGHYQQQIDRLDAENIFSKLRAMPRRCQEAEVHHLDKARERHGGIVAAPLRGWGWMVAVGSEAAVAAAKRV